MVVILSKGRLIKSSGVPSYNEHNSLDILYQRIYITE